jgi:hypothetical protein
MLAIAIRMLDPFHTKNLQLGFAGSGDDTGTAATVLPVPYFSFHQYVFHFSDDLFTVFDEANKMMERQALPLSGCLMLCRPPFYGSSDDCVRPQGLWIRLKWNYCS